jgi:hypothetical protein
VASPVASTGSGGFYNCRDLMPPVGPGDVVGLPLGTAALQGVQPSTVNENRQC